MCVKNKIIKKIKAFTLVELILVLSLASIFIIGAYLVLLPKVKGAQRADIESKNIEAISIGTSTLYAMQGNFSNISNTSLINSRVIPERMVNPSVAGELVNMFTGVVTVTPDNLGGFTNNVYRITYTKVPNYECYYILKQIVNNNYKQVAVNGTTGAAIIKPYPGRVKINMETVGDVCSNNDDNTLHFWNF